MSKIETEHQQLESQVVGTLKDMLARYQRIDLLAEEMLQKQGQGKPINDELDVLQHQREELIGIENNSRPAKEAYRESHSTASQPVKQLTEQTTALIQKLVIKIAKLEDSTRESYQRLIPEIDKNLRGTQMKQAYGKFT